MLTTQENNDFKDYVLDDVLQNTIKWIHKNIDIFEVYSDENIRDYVRRSDPEDYFSKESLDEWAIINGYKKEE